MKLAQSLWYDYVQLVNSILDCVCIFNTCFVIVCFCSTWMVSEIQRGKTDKNGENCLPESAVTNVKEIMCRK